MSDARLDRLATTRPAAAPARLEPEGTAKARFLRARRAGAADQLADLYARAHAIDLPPALIDAARAIAARAPDVTSEAVLHLLLAVLIDVRMGSTRTPVLDDAGRHHLHVRLEPLLGYEAAVAAPAAIAALFEAGLPTLVHDLRRQDDLPPTPLVLDGTAVATHRLFTLECRVVDALAARIAQAPRRTPAEVQRALADVRAHPSYRGDDPTHLSDEQSNAVVRASHLGLTIISGGPGTGKTSIVVALLRTLVRLELPATRLLIAAPTGKAAHRLTESVRRGLDGLRAPNPSDQRLIDLLPEAETLHRLLGYHPRLDAFARNQDDPLTADVVVIDEASMVDLRLMGALLDALPETAQLVLLGDADQLPSVDAGAILRDLRASDRDRQFSVQLTHSYRMDAADPRGADILDAAWAINTGTLPENTVQTRVGRLQHAGYEQLIVEDPLARQRFFDAWVARHLRHRAHQRAARKILLHRNGTFRPDDIRTLDALTEHLNGFRLLAVTRTAALPTGAEALNAAIHERLRADADGLADPFLPGEPVMMLRNDYERGLFNGDVGIVMQVAIDRHAATSMVVFATARGYEPFPQSLLAQDLTLAHAMTVHKAQGSEFDEVALVLPDIDVPVLTKEVLYTGLTRARRSVVVVGAPALVARAAARPVLRHSGVVSRLRSAAVPKA